MHPHSGAHAILSLASTILSFHKYNFNLFHTLSLFTSLHLALYTHFTSSPLPSNITFDPPYYLDNLPLPFSISLLSSCTHIYTNTHTRAHMHVHTILTKPMHTAPYGIVSFIHKSGTTTIKEQTINPVWSQTVVLDDVIMYGPPEHAGTFMPPVWIEFFDRDILVSWSTVGDRHI